MRKKDKEMKTENIRKKIYQNIILLFFFLLAGTSVFLTACGDTAVNRVSTDLPPKDGLALNSLPQDGSTYPPSQDGLASDGLSQDDSAQAVPTQNASPFHSVPAFHDDTGKGIQSHEGYLYGYWNGQLCRYDSDSLEQQCLFSAPSSQSGRFCIYEDHIYFLERPYTASLTNTDTCLYMMDLDGRNMRLLTSQAPNTTAEYSSYNNYGDYYEMDIYDGILYLISNYQENIYYRLDTESHSVTRADESETLYGKLPEGYVEASWYAHIPTLPYQMRHYGYLFLMDQSGDLAVFHPESGILESIDYPTENISRASVFLTNDALYCADSVPFDQPLATWYRISLDDLHKAEVWGQFPPMLYYIGDDIFYDELGVYFSKRDESAINLYQIPWDGSGVTLLYHRYLTEDSYALSPNYVDRYLCYMDGDYFYFNDKKESQCCVMRVSLQGNAPDPETVAAYYEDLLSEICSSDLLEHTFSVQAELDGKMETFSYHTSFTKLYLTEDTAGAHAINAFLQKVYREIQEDIDSFVLDYPESEYMPLPDKTGSYMYVTAYPNYLDERYLGITIGEESYYSGGAHPNTWWDEYVFDRTTGKRVLVTDMVENTPEEICEIGALYVARDHPGLYFLENPELRAKILDDFRFFLSEEGIGIHFNTYELGSYAEGNEDYIIPFWEFDLKPDAIDYRNTEKVDYCHSSRLEVKEPPLPDYMEELGNILLEQMEMGTLAGFLAEHASSWRELSLEEALDYMAADQNGVLKQYYISGKQPGNQWFLLEDSGDIWIRQNCWQDGVPYWIYYHFPQAGEGYLTALDACSSQEEFYFLAWEGTDYLVTVERDGSGNITAASTHCLLSDSVYNGWILRHTLEKDGTFSMKCLCYWM